MTLVPSRGIISCSTMQIAGCSEMPGTDCKSAGQPVMDNTSWSHSCISPKLPRRKWSVTKEISGDDSFDHSNDTVNRHTTDDLLNELAPDVRTAVVEYLRAGDAEVLGITDKTFHTYLHIASELKHSSMLKVCYLYFSQSPKQNQIQNDIKACKCYQTLVNMLFYVLCDSDFECQTEDTNNIAAAQYAVVVPRRSDSDDKNEAHVINLKDFTTVTKKSPHKLQHHGNGFALCALYRKECPYIVISGGEGKHAADLDKYDVLLDKWESPCKLKCARENHLMVDVTGNIYIIGGNNCNSIEKYSPTDNKTEMLDGKLHIEVRSASAAVWKEKVFIFGGKSPLGKVSCVQCFDTHSGKVSRLPDLPCQCSGGQAVVVNDNVFIATHQGHMIMFDPVTGISELCAQQPIMRKHFCMFVKSGQIIVIDGVRTDESSVKHLPACRYDPEMDIWCKLPMLRNQTAIHTNCVISMKKRCPVIPFMNMYLY